MTRQSRSLRWKPLRVTAQVLAVLALLVYFLHLVYPLKTAWRPDLLFQLDPLTHLYLLLTGHGIPQWGWALAALILLFALSRLFCGWLCPLGALLDFTTGLRGRLRLWNARLRRLPPPPPQQHRSLLPANMDVYLLLALLVLAVLRQPLLWLLDPIVISFKFLTVILLPVLDGPLRGAYNGLDAHLYGTTWWLPVSDAYQRFFTSYHPPAYTDTTLFLLFMAAIIGLELWQPRFWCRYICPLGALNRLTYKLHPLKRRLRPDCGFCLRCEGACHFGGTAEDDCLYCMQCIDACAPGKISFLPGRGAARTIPGKVAPAVEAPVTPAVTPPTTATGRDAYTARITGTPGTVRISRRLLLEYAVAGAAAYPLLRVLNSARAMPADFIRPPGVLGQAETPDAAEARFAELCIKCGQCLKTCPTNGLQPALTEAGFAALWTPRLISRLGYCEFSCNLCGQVCPTGAIPKLELKPKQQQVLGTAYFDRNRCIPFITPHNCTVCEEHCPTSDKAIKLRELPPPFWPPERAGNAVSGSGESGAEIDRGVQAAVQHGVTTLQPYIDPALCIGCGICEYVCPVPGLAAVRVMRVPPGSAYAPYGGSGVAPAADGADSTGTSLGGDYPVGGY